MRDLIVCTDCGHEKPRHARGLCQACYTRQRRANPDNRERDRQASLDWKHRNRERNRAYDREHAMDGQCAECDGPMSRGSDGGVCRGCRAAQLRIRRETICAMWADGLTGSAIAREFGWTKTRLGVEIAQARADSWDLPHRRTPEQVARIRAGWLAARAAA